MRFLGLNIQLSIAKQFFDRRDPSQNFSHSVFTERDHAVSDGLLFDRVTFVLAAGGR